MPCYLLVKCLVNCRLSYPTVVDLDLNGVKADSLTLTLSISVISKVHRCVVQKKQCLSCDAAKLKFVSINLDYPLRFTYGISILLLFTCYYPVRVYLQCDILKCH